MKDQFNSVLVLCQYMYVVAVCNGMIPRQAQTVDFLNTELAQSAHSSSCLHTWFLQSLHTPGNHPIFTLFTRLVITFKRQGDISMGFNNSDMPISVAILSSSCSFSKSSMPGNWHSYCCPYLDVMYITFLSVAYKLKTNRKETITQSLQPSQTSTLKPHT